MDTLCRRLDFFNVENKKKKCMHLYVYNNKEVDKKRETFWTNRMQILLKQIALKVGTKRNQSTPASKDDLTEVKRPLQKRNR